MITSKAQVEKILATLPVGYYLGRDIDVALTDESKTYIDLMNEKIFISYPMIERIALTIKDDSSLENDIRCLLYHEISHALLTSKDLEVTNVMNVFEDERIETLLNGLYIGVDFPSFIKRLNDFHGQEPTSAFDLYYQIVRYRIGPKQFVDRVKTIIDTYSRLTIHSSCWNLAYYKEDVTNLYEDILDFWKIHSEEFEKSKESENSEESEGSVYKPYHGDKTSKSSLDNIKDKVKAIITTFYDNKIIEDFDRILSNVKHTSKMSGSAMNAYSGKFDPRSVVRNDYKYFVQQNRAGHVKAYSKTHLNLFIDVSGSFSSSEKTVNKMLYALARFENKCKDFSFDVVTCQMGQKILDRKHRQIECGGGNRLTKDIYNQVKSLQFKDANNINIVLFDGDAFTDKRSGDDGHAFRAFDVANTIIISDSDNEGRLKEDVSIAKVIITRNYTDELYSEVTNALKVFAR